MNKEIPSLERVSGILQNSLDEEILDVKHIERDGGDSIIFLAKTKSGKYFLRAGGKRENYDVENEVLKILEKNNVMVPETVFCEMNPQKLGFAFMIQRKIPGKNMYKIERSLWPRILRSVGKQLSMIYKIKFPGFGPIDVDKFRNTGELVGSFDSWTEYLKDNFDKKIDGVAKKAKIQESNGFAHTNLSKLQIDKLLKIVDGAGLIKNKINKDIDMKAGHSLIQGDPHFEHFLVDKGKLSGIIDFNKTLIGDPLYDIAYFSVMPNGEYYPDLLEKSGIKMDKELFEIYRLLIATGKIYTRYVEFDYLNRFSNVLDIVIDKLN